MRRQNAFPIILGRTPAECSALSATLGLLGSDPDRACRRFLDRFRGRQEGDLIRMPPSTVHTAVFAPTGAGKFVSLIAPMLFMAKGSVVLIDPSGEGARLTWAHRRRMSRVVNLDPYDCTGLPKDCFNPVSLIDPTRVDAFDLCFSMAKSLTPRTGQEHETHWNDRTEELIAGLLALSLFWANPEDRSLVTAVDAILNDPQRLEYAINLMCQPLPNGEYPGNGALPRIGGSLKSLSGQERASVLSNTARHLQWIRTPVMAEVTSKNTFNPSFREPTTVYISLPPEHLESKSAWLRICVDALMRAVIRNGQQEENLTHFIFDEAASLGANFQCARDALDKYRKYGIRCTYLYQDIGQLQKCWPDGGDQTLLANTSQIFWAVNDLETAKHVSEKIGQRTAVVESGGSNYGWSSSHSIGQHSNESSGRSGGSSTSWGLQGVPVIRPEQIIALPARAAITFTPGCPRPVLSTLLRYYEEPWLWKRSWWKEWLRAISVFGRAAIFLVMTALAAYCAHELAQERGVFNRASIQQTGIQPHPKARMK